MMKLIALIFIVSLAMLASAQAGPFEDGINAYQQGDYATALTKYRKAAEQGHAQAQNNLGLMYDTGQGVQQDYQKAVKWYRMAAKQGYPRAQYNMGVMYQAGLGVDKNIDQAIALYMMAANQGYADARRQLNKILPDTSKGVSRGVSEGPKSASPGMPLAKTNQQIYASTAAEESVATTDNFNVQIYSMPSKGKMHIVDFHYDSKGACINALAKRKSMYAARQPKFKVLKEYCTTSLSARLAKMINREKAGWPYFAFQDMRQWIDGVDRSTASDFCHKTAKNPGFPGGARCIE